MIVAQPKNVADSNVFTMRRSDAARWCAFRFRIFLIGESYRRRNLPRRFADGGAPTAGWKLTRITATS
jgi:hypothetical protein